MQKTKKPEAPFNLRSANAANERRTGVRGVYDLYEDLETSGDVTIKRYIWQEKDDFLYNARMIRDGYPFMQMYDGGYVRMHVGRELMMSDTCMERRTNVAFIRESHGHVLVAGLGLGMVLRNILDKPEVTTVTVIEKNTHVIDLVAPKFAHKKLSVIAGDIFDYKAPRKFDTMYFDIWHNLSTENLPEITQLHNKFKNHKAPGGWMNSWVKEFLQKEKRSNSRY